MVGRPAYIISAYKEPALLEGLVEALADNPIAIHIDAKSDIHDRIAAGIGRRGNVTMLPRHVCHWGMFGHVAATLEGLAWFAGVDATHAILLTGQCFPMLSQAAIADRLTALGDRSVIEYTRFPKPEWSGDNGGFDRVNRYRIRIPFKRGPIRIPKIKRSMPDNLHPYGGAGYWCMARQAAAMVLDYVDRNPEVVRFFKSTFVPDEIFFQTILCNSAMIGSIDDDTIHYFQFLKDQASPELIGVDEIETVMASGKWFCRKVGSVEVQQRLLARLSTDRAVVAG